MTSNFPLYPSPGVMINKSDQTYEPIKRADLDQDSGTITVRKAPSGSEEYSTDGHTPGRGADTIEFESNGSQYVIRPIRSEDGYWLSDLHTSIPIDALMDKVTGDNMNETLTAYMLDDSPYVVGLVYHTDNGDYSREDGMWVQLSPDDDLFSNDDVYSADIDPSKADEFINLYDDNYVSVDDLTDYESADSEPEEDSDSSEE